MARRARRHSRPGAGSPEEVAKPSLRGSSRGSSHRTAHGVGLGRTKRIVIAAAAADPGAAIHAAVASRQYAKTAGDEVHAAIIAQPALIAVAVRHQADAAFQHAAAEPASRPFALAAIAIGIAVDAMAPESALDEAALVASSVRPQEHSRAGHHVFLPLP